MLNLYFILKFIKYIFLNIRRKLHIPVRFEKNSQIFVKQVTNR